MRALFVRFGVLAAALSGAFSQDIDHVDVVTFDGAKGTTFDWKLVNDPVMGGLSNSTWTPDMDAGTVAWAGEVKIVPKLQAPGFCNAETTGSVFTHFNSIAGFTHLEIYMRSAIDYDGFKVSLAADTLIPQFHSFKAGFNVTSDNVWRVVSVPLSDFSNDWSDFTGRCDNNPPDPNGKTHKCCTKDTSEVCMTEKNLKDISQVGLWTEGVAGKFDIEIAWIRGGFGDTCSSSEYCCPDAKHCLTPTDVTCKDDDSVCADGTVCCPLTKLCVKIGNSCTSPCAAKGGDGQYCCPDALHCLAPSNPGVLCKDNTDCNSGDVCCPLTNICVTPGDACQPGDAATPSWWPAQQAAAEATTLVKVNTDAATHPKPLGKAPRKAGAIVVMSFADEPRVGNNTCPSGGLQKNLRYNVGGITNDDNLPFELAPGETLAEAICCDSAFQPYAEPVGFFATPRIDLFSKVNRSGVTTFYDSQCGVPLFEAPTGRSLEQWIDESTAHGWPSFRKQELVLDEQTGNPNLIVRSTGEVVSTCGTHLGTMLPDDLGDRYCLDLVALSGSPVSR